MAVQLLEPTPELANKLLSEVGFEQKITGCKIAQMGGQDLTFLYGLEEVSRFMNVDEFGVLMTLGGSPSIGQIDLEDLRKWVEEVFGDKELAKAIEEVIAHKDIYPERCGPVKELLEQRINQCKAVLAKKAQKEIAKQG